MTILTVLRRIEGVDEVLTAVSSPSACGRLILLSRRIADPEAGDSGTDDTCWKCLHLEKYFKSAHIYWVRK